MESAVTPNLMNLENCLLKLLHPLLVNVSYSLLRAVQRCDYDVLQHLVFFSSLSYPGNRLTECGISSPPSTAPFIAANTLAPVEVRAKPTSRQHLKAPGPSSLSSSQK